ncbi:MAG TPA: hypothetical protein VIM61_01065 [Chthoniobacterales bacterium]
MLSNIFELTAWLPIRTIPFPGTVEKSKAAIAAYCTGLPQLAKALQPGITTISALVKAPSAKIIKQIAIGTHPWMFEQRFITFVLVEAGLQYDLDELARHNPDSKFTDEDLYGIAASELASFLQDSLIYGSLAHPGDLHSFAGRVFIHDHPMNQCGAVSGFPHNAIDEDDTPSWPSLSILPFEKIVSWAPLLELHENGVGHTKIERALASFTNLLSLSSVEVPSMLFWAMQGLEAFYCQGVGDLRRQLSEKVKIFLGEWPNKSNIVGQAYDLRSRFVHGSFPIQRWNDGGFPDGSVEKDYEALHDASELAVCMLTATLQKCILHGFSEVTFDWRLTAK